MFCFILIYRTAVLLGCIIITSNAFSGRSRNFGIEREGVPRAESTPRITAFRNAPVSTGEEIERVFPCVWLALLSRLRAEFSVEYGWNHGSAVPVWDGTVLFYIKGDHYENLQYAYKTEGGACSDK